MLNRISSALVIPAAYHSAKTGEQHNAGKFGFSLFDNNDPATDLDPIDQHGLLTISRGTALLLLAVYVVYLFFQVREIITHRNRYAHFL
jgi:Ca2+/H+ antiporter